MLKMKIANNVENKSELTLEIERLLAEADASITKARNYLISQGEVVDLAEWVTIKEYCNRFGIKNVETVINWISRGIVPAENVRTIEEFNHTKLIKAVPYKSKATA